MLSLDKNINLYRPWHNAGAFFGIGALVCVHFSPALASIFTGLAIACALFIAVRTKLTFWSLKSPWMWMALFVIWQCIASLLVPEMEGLPEKLTLRLPLLFLPLLTVIKPDKKLWPYLLLLLSMPLVWISLASIANYFNHFQFYNQMIVESKPLPLFSLVYHIEYSLIQSCTALVLLLFLRKEWKAQPHSMLMVALAVCGVLLFAALHILSARTGILAFWLGLVAAVVFNRERQIKRWKLITAAILVVALAFAVPSIRNRISNSYQDFKAVVNQTDLNHKSFGQRWVAWGTGMQVIQKAPLMGHGLGNVHRAMKSAYAAESGGLDANNQINPHNQYIEVGVQSGILGIALLLVFYVLGIWKGIHGKNSYQISILVALAAAMLFESILERQSGVLVVLVFVGFWCNWRTKEAE